MGPTMGHATGGVTCVEGHHMGGVIIIFGHMFVGHYMSGAMYGVTHLIMGPPTPGRVPYLQNSLSDKVSVAGRGGSTLAAQNREPRRMARFPESQVWNRENFPDSPLSSRQDVCPSWSSVSVCLSVLGFLAFLPLTNSFSFGGGGGRGVFEGSAWRFFFGGGGVSLLFAQKKGNADLGPAARSTKVS